jgi:hypothetical protein
VADNDYKPVVFEDSQGNEISNDPVYQAQKLLEQQFGANGRQPRYPDDESLVPDDEYNDMNGAELKKLAKERGVDISGLKTVGEVRTRLREADAAQSPADSNGTEQIKQDQADRNEE